jgi:hypothetical protein
MKSFLLSLLFFVSCISQAQVQWQNVDTLYGPLPGSLHVYRAKDIVDTAPFKAFYMIADLKDKDLVFTTDTTLDRRLTPSQFFDRNKTPLVVVNGTFFSFQTNRNLNAVIKNGKLVSGNVHTVPGRGKDTLTYRHPFTSAIGIHKKRRADVAWLLTDPPRKNVYASQWPIAPLKDSVAAHKTDYYLDATSVVSHGPGKPPFAKWKMQTAIGGGPVLLQRGAIRITNNEELKFTGKAIHDKHPRTAMGYTADNKLIILVIEGRTKESKGATLVETAQVLKDLGCVEALNLDGGGSSCLLVNGKETIRPSDPSGQRPVPAVFLIKKR